MQVSIAPGKGLAPNKQRRGTLRWRHNGRDSVSNHQPHDCLLNRLFRRRSKKTSKLRVAGLCVGNSPGTGEFPAQMASNAENVSIWWRHHDLAELPNSPLIWLYTTGGTFGNRNTDINDSWWKTKRCHLAGWINCIIKSSRHVHLYKFVPELSKCMAELRIHEMKFTNCDKVIHGIGLNYQIFTPCTTTIT